MIRLRNNTGATSKPGYVVAVDPKDPKSFVYVSSGATKAIGVVMESVPYRSLCNIATIGERVDVYTTTSVVKGSILRTVKAGDNRTQGSVVIAKSGDAPYFRVGEALTDGRGFIPIILDFQYAFSSGSTISWTDITGKPNEGAREVTDDTTELTTDRTIICNKATAMTVDLLTATGSFRIREIDNKGAGAVTVYPYADPSNPSPAETIEGETSQIIYTNSCMVIKDVAVGEWRII